MSGIFFRLNLVSDAGRMDESNRFGVKLKAPKGSRIAPSQAEKLNSQGQNGVGDAGNKSPFKQQQPEKTTDCLRKVKGSNQVESSFPEVALNIDLVNKFNQLTNPGEKTKEVEKADDNRPSRRRCNSIREVKNTFGVELKTASTSPKAARKSAPVTGGVKKPQPECTVNSNPEGEDMMGETEMEEELNILEGRIAASRRRCSSVEEVRNTFGVQLKAALQEVNEVRKEIESFQKKESNQPQCKIKADTPKMAEKRTNVDQCAPMRTNVGRKEKFEKPASSVEIDKQDQLRAKLESLELKVRTLEEALGQEKRKTAALTEKVLGSQGTNGVEAAHKCDSVRTFGDAQPGEDVSPETKIDKTRPTGSTNAKNELTTEPNTSTETVPNTNTETDLNTNTETDLKTNTETDQKTSTEKTVHRSTVSELNSSTATEMNSSKEAEMNKETGMELNLQTQTAKYTVDTNLNTNTEGVKNTKEQISPEEENNNVLEKDAPADDTSTEEEDECTLQRTRTILAISKKYEARGRNLSSRHGSQSDKPATIEEENEPVDEPELKKSSRGEKRASRCWHAVQEIMSSEKSYVTILQILDEFRKHVESKITKTSEEGVRIYQMSLFTILPQLLMLNSHLLEEFETRITNWATHKKIADVLVKKGNFLKIYSAYMDTFEQTNSIFQECVRKFQRFAKLVKEFEKLPLCQSLGLQGHMLAPVQRLPRYKMLLETYLKYQEENAEDFEDTQNAIKIVISVTNASNKGLHEKEMMNKMKELQKKFGSEFELIQPARSLLKEGALANVTIWEVPQPCHAILVNDSLLIACPKVTKIHSFA